MSVDGQYAPGWPGIAARWTTSAKSGVGTALSSHSRVWFTISHGILNEVYYPRVDQACTRDLGLIVTDGNGFFSEEKRQTETEVETLAAGVPAYKLANTCVQGNYRIEKVIVSDPRRDVVLQRTRFLPLRGTLSDYHVYVLLASHLGNYGAGNTAWLGDYKGVPMLFAMRDGQAMALASSTPWLKRSVGFVGTSDGWQDLSQHGQMTWTYTRAAPSTCSSVSEPTRRKPATVPFPACRMALKPHSPNTSKPGRPGRRSSRRRENRIPARSASTMSARQS
jgi:glucoamylase